MVSKLHYVIRFLIRKSGQPRKTAKFGDSHPIRCMVHSSDLFCFLRLENDL